MFQRLKALAIILLGLLGWLWLALVVYSLLTDKMPDFKPPAVTSPESPGAAE